MSTGALPKIRIEFSRLFGWNKNGSGRLRVRQANLRHARPVCYCYRAQWPVVTLESLMARQRLGQHFLSGPGWQKRILDTLPHGSQEVWIEIGPGHGEMTKLLAAKGRRLIAIEADTRLAANLQEVVRAQPDEWPGVEIVSGDVLELDLAKLADSKFRVYGNLPYYITSPILHQLFGCATQIASIHVVMQLEVAERIVARPGRREYGYLSAACQFYTQPKLALKIPPGAFRPPPMVTSALVQMTLPGEGASLGITDEAEIPKVHPALFRAQAQDAAAIICAPSPRISVSTMRSRPAACAPTLAPSNSRSHTSPHSSPQ